MLVRSSLADFRFRWTRWKTNYIRRKHQTI